MIIVGLTWDATEPEHNSMNATHDRPPLTVEMTSMGAMYMQKAWHGLPFLPPLFEFQMQRTDGCICNRTGLPCVTRGSSWNTPCWSIERMIHVDGDQSVYPGSLWDYSSDGQVTPVFFPSEADFQLSETNVRSGAGCSSTRRDRISVFD
ncbi:hypothetical protein PDE_03567 [Penicillium oxalicum 114-2]|uniref:Uncharacterized protein n=1 Tax=Penicillium oxalicum (strain 114-2 / CGMCC 5302) TaxID=933388 RepID=S7ZIV5_PENO1|nr:hypothetical protein PDE_03567 [Penicillium oxalicum 114-2]